MDDIYRLSQNQLAIFDRSYKRYFPREHNLSHRLCVILGQRGVGKTTAVAFRIFVLACCEVFVGKNIDFSKEWIRFLTKNIGTRINTDLHG